MFLSYAVVPVFVFTILLNFIYVYSDGSNEMDAPPMASEDPPAAPAITNFTTCDECMKSDCHAVSKAPCIPNNGTSTTFQCHMCTNDTDGNPHFYDEATCKSKCTTDGKTCVCQGGCYSCLLQTDDPDANNVTYSLPTQMANDQCELVGYTAPGINGTVNGTNNINAATP